MTKDIQTQGRNRFQYIHMDSKGLTHKYVPHPASNPRESYVAKLKKQVPSFPPGTSEMEIEARTPDETYCVVDEVYRLIPSARRSEDLYVTNKKGKTLVTRVSKGEAVDALHRIYDGTHPDAISFDSEGERH